jgi:hypothetical protein
VATKTQQEKLQARVVPNIKAISRFHAAVRELGRISGKDFEAVMKAEMAALLTTAQKNTIKASVKKIEAHEENRKAITMDGKVYFLPASGIRRKYPDAVWREIERRKMQRITRRKNARGLASRMWLHIANNLGVTIKGVPAYVRKAMSGREDMEKATFAYASGVGNKYRIGFINALTDSNIGAMAGQAFNVALTMRANFFSQAVKLAAKGKIRSVLARYPGLARVS